MNVCSHVMSHPLRLPIYILYEDNVNGKICFHDGYNGLHSYKAYNGLQVVGRGKYASIACDARCLYVQTVLGLWREDLSLITVCGQRRQTMHYEIGGRLD